MIKTDEYGFEYYQDLPEGSELCKNIWPFVTVDPSEEEFYKVNLGMKYLIFSGETNHYELYEINSMSLDTNLIKYIDEQRVFLLPLHPIS